MQPYGGVVIKCCELKECREMNKGAQVLKELKGGLDIRMNVYGEMMLYKCV